ncbi:MAG: hypothetical protein HYR88_10220, partial [Verrucomicrobia bacterium]|nr:hypothetical protein [Verrucomicrobiota bacterium]
LQINWAADQLLRVFKPEARQALWGAEPAAVVEEGASPEAGSRLGSQDEAA